MSALVLKFVQWWDVLRCLGLSDFVRFDFGAIATENGIFAMSRAMGRSMSRLTRFPNSRRHNRHLPLTGIETLQPLGLGFDTRNRNRYLPLTGTNKHPLLASDSDPKIPPFLFLLMALNSMDTTAAPSTTGMLFAANPHFTKQSATQLAEDFGCSKKHKYSSQDINPIGNPLTLKAIIETRVRKTAI